jgi:hypothetical protein
LRIKRKTQQQVRYDCDIAIYYDASLIPIIKTTLGNASDSNNNSLSSSIFLISFWPSHFHFMNYSFFLQIEEKTFTHTTSTHANRTEQTVVTQEVRATATVVTSDQGVIV